MRDAVDEGASDNLRVCLMKTLGFLLRWPQKSSPSTAKVMGERPLEIPDGWLQESMYQKYTFSLKGLIDSHWGDKRSEQGSFLTLSLGDRHDQG